MSDTSTSLTYKLFGHDVTAGKTMDETAEKAKSTGKKIAVGLGAATLAGGAAAGAILGNAFAENMDFGQANAKLKAQLGLSGSDASKAGRVAGKVFADNWGAGAEDINAALKAVAQNMGGVAKLSEADLQSMTESALALSQTFEVDVSESAASAAALVKNGLVKNSKEAFDLITSGFQGGADKAGDFLDTLTEYSPQFSKLGIDGTEALGILSRGLKAGARDTDTIADAFKEFSIRSIDGSTLTASGFKAIGLNAKDMAKAIAKGGDSAEQATEQTLQGLLKIKDPIKQNTAGTALFGTQWEDTVRKILPNLIGIEEGATDVAGSTKKMTDALGASPQAKVDGMKRSFQAWTMSLVGTSGPLGDVAAGVLNFSQPALTMAGSLGGLVTGLAALKVGTLASTGAQLAASAVSKTWAAAQWLLNVALSANPIGLVIIAIVALVAAFVIAYKNSQTFRNIVQAAMGGVVVAFHAVAAAFGWAWGKIQSGFGWVKSHWPLLVGILGGPFGIAVALIVTHWNGIIGFFKAAPGKIAGALSGMWSPLWSGFKSVINSIIGGWNRLHFGLPSIDLGPLGSVGGFDIGVPQIPYLAKGGIVTKPTLAMLGEAGKEAVVPLDRGGLGGDEYHFHFSGPFTGNAQDFVRAVQKAMRTTQAAGLA